MYRMPELTTPKVISQVRGGRGCGRGCGRVVGERGVVACVCQILKSLTFACFTEVCGVCVVCLCVVCVCVCDVCACV